MTSTRLRDRFARGEAALGLWSSTASPVVAEILAGAGADWLLFDMEHSHAELGAVLAQLQGAKGTGTVVLVRPPSHDAQTIKRLLDLGADNLLIPRVDDVRQAQLIVEATRYPPHGSRGVAGSNRGADYGRDRSYLKDANDRVCLILQIESASGVRNAKQIALAEGVDALFVGPADLSADLGRLGEPNHPEVQEAISSVVQSCKAAGKPVGVFGASPEDAAERLSQGFDFVSVASDVRLLVHGAQQALDVARRAASRG